MNGSETGMHNNAKPENGGVDVGTLSMTAGIGDGVERAHWS